MKMRKRLGRMALIGLLSVSMFTAIQPTAQAQSYHTVAYQQYNWNQWYFWFTPSTYYTAPKQETTTPKQETAAPKEPQTPAVTPTKTPVEAPTTTPVTEPTAAPVEQTNTSMSAVELEVVKLVNVERAKYGLAPLKASSELSAVARDKSKDMRDRGYFDHQSPTYGSPFDMMTSYGIQYRTAGENIAAGQRTAQEVVTAWMNSEGHRKNILNASFTTLGVGYVTGGSYQHYWTQMFTG